MDTDASCYCHRSVTAVIKSAEEEKKESTMMLLRQGEVHFLLLLCQWMGLLVWKQGVY